MSSKLYANYVSLKIKSPYKKYLFKSGIFYIFIDDDAKELHKLLNLKLGNLNSQIVKCGFPVNSLDKYMKLLKQYGYAVEIVDFSTNSLFNYEEYLFKTKIHKFIDKISHLEIDSLSISKAYDILEDLKHEANNILEVIPYEEKKKFIWKYL